MSLRKFSWTDHRNDRLSDEKEEDEITLPSQLQHHAMGKPPFFYPGTDCVTKTSHEYVNIEWWVCDKCVTNA